MPEIADQAPQKKNSYLKFVIAGLIPLLLVVAAFFLLNSKQPKPDQTTQNQPTKTNSLKDYDKKVLEIASSDGKVKGTAGLTYRDEKLSVTYNLYFTENFKSGLTRAGKIDIPGEGKDLTGLISARYCDKDKVGDAFSVYFADPFKCSVHGGETNSFYLAAIAQASSYQDLLNASKLEVFEAKDSFASLEKVLSSGSSIRTYELTMTERSTVKGASSPPPGPPPTPPTPPTPPPTPPATPPTTPPTSNPTPPPTPAATTKTTTDKTAPIITDLVISDISATTARVTWKTNEAATSSIQYGPTTTYGQKDQIDSKNTEHSFVLENLEDGTVYYLKVSSTDAAGNAAQSEEKTFTTVELKEAETETMPLVEKKSSVPWLPIGLVGVGLLLGMILFFWKKRKKKTAS